MSSVSRRALLHAYPRRWRERYGDELLGLLDEDHPDTALGIAASADLFVGGLTERATSVFGVPERAADSAAGSGFGLLAWGWCLVVLGGVSLAKVAEHASQAPQTSPGILGGVRGASVAFDVIQWCAVVGSVCVAVLAALALLVALRTARGAQRGRILARGAFAGGAIVVAAGFLVLVAHAASVPGQHIGPAGQTAWVLAAAAIGSAVFASLTRVLVAAFDAVAPPRGLGVALAWVVAASTTMLVAATSAWGAAIAAASPRFLTGPAAGTTFVNDGRTVIVVTSTALVAGAVLSVLGAWRAAGSSTHRTASAS